MRLAGELGVLDGVELLEPEPAPDDRAPAHPRPVVPGGGPQSAPVNGDDPAHGLGTDDNPIFEGMHEASALVCGGSLAAAREIAEGRAERAVNIAGGLHHAMADRAAGFCVYNDCAVAISWLLDHGFERIAYVDVDVHHGDGVQAAFYDDPRVLDDLAAPAPAHAVARYRVAGRVRRGRGRGLRGERGAPARHRGRGLVARLPRGGALAAPARSVRRCWSPSAVPTPTRKTRWRDLRLSVDGHRTIYRELRGLAERTAGGKWLALGGGGYGLFRVVPRSWTHLLATVLDRDVDPRDAGAGRVDRATPPGSPGGRCRRRCRTVSSVAHEPWGEGADERVDASVHRHAPGGVPAARSRPRRPARLSGPDLRSSRPDPEREEHDDGRGARGGRARPAGAGLPAALGGRRRRVRRRGRAPAPDPARRRRRDRGASTPGSPSAPATCATSARTRTSPRATSSGSPSSTTTTAWRSSPCSATRSSRSVATRARTARTASRSSVRPRSRSSCATTTRAEGSARSCSSTSPRPAASGACAASRPRCSPRTAQMVRVFRDAGYQVSRDVRRRRAASRVRHRPHRALDGGPRRPRAARRGAQRAQRCCTRARSP